MLNIKKEKVQASKKEKDFIKKSPGLRTLFIIVFILLCLYSATLIFPFAWLAMSSLKGSYDYILSDTFAFPQVWMFRNYIDVFAALDIRGVKFFEMTFNSLWWTVGNTVFGIFMSSVVAYCLSKYKFKARGFMYGVIIFTMVVPIYGAGASAYKQAQDLGIINSPLMLVKSLGGYGGFQFLVLYAFFKNISWEYAQAARIDGAGHFRIFFQIMLPLAWGPIVSLVIVAAIGTWNDYTIPLVYLYNYPTLATGLFVYESLTERAVNYPLYYAGVFVSIIPVLIIFIAFQNTIMNNVTMGGLKG